MKFDCKPDDNMKIAKICEELEKGYRFEYAPEVTTVDVDKTAVSTARDVVLMNYRLYERDRQHLNLRDNLMKKVKDICKKQDRDADNSSSNQSPVSPQPEKKEKQDPFEEQKTFSDP